MNWVRYKNKDQQKSNETHKASHLPNTSISSTSEHLTDYVPPQNTFSDVPHYLYFL